MREGVNNKESTQQKEKSSPDRTVKPRLKGLTIKKETEKL
jgi:hypothetical protein